MTKREMLAYALANHPNHELIFMYSDESSDHAYTLGEATSVRVDEYTQVEERVYFMNGDYEELKDEIEEAIWDTKFNSKNNLSEEEKVEMSRLTKAELAKLEWKSAIIVHVNPKA